MKLLFPDASHRSPSAVSGRSELISFARSYEIGAPEKPDPFSPGSAFRVVIPHSGPYKLTISWPQTAEYSISRIAAHGCNIAGASVQIVVCGKPNADFALDHLEALWPEPYKIEVVLLARSDALAIVATHPCTVVLFGAYKADVR